MNAEVGGSSAAAAKRRVKEGLKALRAGLVPYVEKHMRDRPGTLTHRPGRSILP